MIKDLVNQYFRTLESAFENDSNTHIYLTDATGYLKGDLDNLNGLALGVIESLGDCNPYEETFESYFQNCVNTLGKLCNAGVDDALALGVASLSYIGFMEGLLDLPIYNINGNSDEAYIEFLAHGNPVETTQMESVGDTTLDLINSIRRTSLDDTHLERFVKSEYQLVEDQSQSLKTLIPWVPLEDPLRANPEQDLLGSMIQVDTILNACKKIQYDRPIDLTETDLLSCIIPDKEIVLRSFGNGDSMNDSIVGTYLIFLHGLLNGILTHATNPSDPSYQEINDTSGRDRLQPVSKVELLPMVRYVRDTITQLMPTRMDNRYAILGLMLVNAIMGMIEHDYFHQYSEETKVFADRLYERYNGSLKTVFDSNRGINKHGVPDDMYTWMMTCLQSTVLPESTKGYVRDTSIYPAIGPVRLLFESTEFRSSDAALESMTPVEKEAICESMVRSLIKAVDPSGIESPVTRVDSPVGESGAMDLTKMFAVMEVLHRDAAHARRFTQVRDIANITAAQKLVVESVRQTELTDVDARYAKSVLENTLSDIANGEDMISPYVKLPSFRPTLSAADANASTMVQDILTKRIKK